MMQSIIFTLIVIFFFFKVLPCWALPAWDLKQTYESKAVLKSPFFLFTAADLNTNGTKELIVTDFGRYGDHIEEWKQWKKIFSPYHLMILEWEKNELKIKFQKQWDRSKARSDAEEQEYFQAYEAQQMVSWQVGNQVLVETIPPYLGVEWQNGKYLLREQQGSAQKKPLVGSWAFPWLSPSCYASFPNKPVWPRECIVGVRDFSGWGIPNKIVTILEEEIIKNKQYKQILRVRKFEPGFPIEWAKQTPQRLDLMEPIDRLSSSTSKLLIRVYGTSNWDLFEQAETSNDYTLRELSTYGPRGIANYDLPDFYLRKTQQGGTEEYWGYRRTELSDPNSLNFIVELRKVPLKPDLSEFIQEDIDFPHHEHYLGVGYFIVEDIDGDGVDEIILVEQTAGKLTFGEETVYYGDIKDYVHILKWNGTKYQDMWVSPPFTKRGTKLLVDDIKHAGKKQLVVLSPYGTIQIWERQ